MAKEKPAGVDLIVAMGGPSKKGPASKASKEAEDDYGDDEVPAEFEAAYKEFEKSHSAQALYDCIKACHGE